MKTPPNATRLKAGDIIEKDDTMNWELGDVSHTSPVSKFQINKKVPKKRQTIFTYFRPNKCN